MPDDLASDYVTHARPLGEAGRSKAEAVMGLELTGGLTETLVLTGQRLALRLKNFVMTRNSGNVGRALDGTKISEGSFEHVHRFQGGLIARMDIQKVDASTR